MAPHKLLSYIRLITQYRLIFSVIAFLTLFTTTVYSASTAPSLIEPRQTSTPLAKHTYKLNYRIIDSIDMPAGCFTQGFLIYQQSFYLSCGRYGQSSIRQVSMTGELLREVKLPRTIFAEGLAIIEQQIYVSSWKSGKVLIYRLNDFSLKRIQIINQQVWGFANSNNTQHFIVSDGSHRIKHVQQLSLKSREALTVIDDTDKPIMALNELEAIGHSIWANIWKSQQIAVIATRWNKTLQPLATLNLSLLTDKHTIKGSEEVLNGIAYDAHSDCLWVTGKNWSKAYALAIDLPPELIKISQNPLNCTGMRNVESPQSPPTLKP